MGHSYRSETLILANGSEPIVTKLPGSHLDADSMAPGIFQRVKIRFNETDPMRLCPIPDKKLVGVALLSPKMEVTVGQGNRTANRTIQEQVRHHHGIDSSAHGKKDRSPTIRKQSAQTFAETVPHSPGLSYFLLVKEYVNPNCVNSFSWTVLCPFGKFSSTTRTLSS